MLDRKRKNRDFQESALDSIKIVDNTDVDQSQYGRGRRQAKAVTCPLVELGDLGSLVLIRP